MTCFYRRNVALIVGTALYAWTRSNTAFGIAALGVLATVCATVAKDAPAAATREMETAHA